ncbi:protein of unknown function [Methylocella tundrae]|uniref:Uncharacterized protein n=1 Tax=Methylocella tundrae TaxID=227605 RepID=A0A4U8Z5Z8_METTU|nr:hypothetical protein [Methylocella tundrae]VFU10966.1 protein of unknown function [Methylocella tundrae]
MRSATRLSPGRFRMKRRLLLDAQAAVIDKYQQYEDIAARDGSRFVPGVGVVVKPAS